MGRSIATFLIISTLLVAVPVSVSAITLVPCGRDLNNNKKLEAAEQCDLEDIVTLITRMINYLITVAALVATYQVLTAGFNLITALGSPDKIKTAREGIGHAVVGFAMVILAFVFVNLLVNGIFGKPGAERKWWSPKCVYLDTKDCPLGISVPK